MASPSPPTAEANASKKRTDSNEVKEGDMAEEEDAQIERQLKLKGQVVCVARWT